MRRFLGFCGVLAVIFWMIGAFRARGETTWTPHGSGLESRVLRWHGVSIHAFRAPAARVEVATGGYFEAAGWLKQSKARVAINGGYFDGRGAPMGLRVSRKQKTSSLRRADWGVFWISKGAAHIAHTRDFSADIRPDEAIQCGPRLVVKGKATDLKPQWSRRSGLGIDGRGRVVLAIADGQLSLEDWAQVFASPTGLGCRDALNLDGGPSTQLALSKVKGRENVRGGWPVPDAVVIR
ncbi:putative protein (DUF2233) [Abditibacterium utsteinense]|uniref:Phosphodiester glycosidase domain-containing protein n=1 Tax=Abditibacterium utsteinense TaxID=1960156 RepID=A0A2S8SS20_9BACT|nr:phosphodiester glycosidase family protein [Abditibacterium utsteinense]PQV63612.1 putative protein (DUF2233) [Abditibacterium utsteinense]